MTDKRTPNVNDDAVIDQDLAARMDAALADAVPQQPLSAAQSRRMRDRIMARAALADTGGAPVPSTAVSEPEGTATVRGGEQGFEPFGDGIVRKLLVADDGAGRETALYRLDPGSFFETHSHTHLEECWVLEGDVLVGDFPVHTGDMHLAWPGYDHPRVLAPNGALLLIKSQSYAPGTTVPAGEPP